MVLFGFFFWLVGFGSLVVIFVVVLFPSPVDRLPNNQLL